MSTKQDLENLMSDKFIVSLNTRKQAFYSDGVITLTMNNQSCEIDPKNYANLDLLKKNIEYGFLNIIDKDGNILYSSFYPKLGQKIANKEQIDVSTKDTLTEDEEKYIKNILALSSSNVIRNIKKINKLYLIDAIIKREEASRAPRKSVLFEAKKQRNILLETRS